MQKIIVEGNLTINIKCSYQYRITYKTYLYFFLFRACVLEMLKIMLSTALLGKQGICNRYAM